jgi:hypothetical protein
MIITGDIVLLSKSYTYDDILSIDTIKQDIFRRTPSDAPTLTDNQITRLRNSAIDRIEKIIGTTLLDSDYKISLPNFSNSSVCPSYVNRTEGIRILHPYVKSISSFKYKQNNTLNDFDVEMYYLRKAPSMSDVVIDNQKDLPEYANNVNSFYGIKVYDAIQITFKSGLFDLPLQPEPPAEPIPINININSAIIDAIITYCKSKFEGCEDTQAELYLSKSIKELFYSWNYSESGWAFQELA